MNPTTWWSTVAVSWMICVGACEGPSPPPGPCGHWRELAFPAGTEFHGGCDDRSISGRTDASPAAFVKLFTDRGYVASRSSGETFAKASRFQYLVKAGDPVGFIVFVDPYGFTLSRRSVAEFTGTLTEGDFAQLSDEQMRTLHGAAIKRAKALVPLFDRTPDAPKVCAGAADELAFADDAIVINVDGPELAAEGKARGPYSIGVVRAPGEYAASKVTDLMKLRDQLRAFMASPVVPAYRLESASTGQQFHGDTFLGGGARIDVALLDEAAGTVRCRTTTSASNSQTVTVYGQNDSNNAEFALRTDLAGNIDTAVHKALITLLPAR
ncbi:hypothetical protein [Nannocystis punicea]|uniref:Lipoprotein n=1 Tax=Nannocystis punicea TaxID=2995304 RepID=A0ABY7GWV7_9BACT|nr:hypothetical protein [Nannocystis poenicansa]WAS91354.1 hypothetical protein O0S08_34635 [Nannocystis poenicansa]